MRIPVRHGPLGVALAMATSPAIAAGPGQFKDLPNNGKVRIPLPGKREQAGKLANQPGPHRPQFDR